MTDEAGFTHLDARGRPRMVDVGEKAVTRRIAVAEGHIRMRAETLEALLAGGGRGAKGNVLVTAELAGIQGAKRTAELIPLCHPLLLESVDVTLAPDASLPGLTCTATVRVEAKTGVEMEALTAVSCALLTVYDMCKARDREMRIEGVRLLRKEGGRTGPWTAGEEG